MTSKQFICFTCGYKSNSWYDTKDHDNKRHYGRPQLYKTIEVENDIEKPQSDDNLVERYYKFYQMIKPTEDKK